MRAALLEYGDKVVLGGFLVLLVVGGVGAATRPAGSQVPQDLSDAVQVIDAHRAPTVALPPTPRWADEARDALDPERVPVVRDFPGWFAMERRPYLLFDVVPKDPRPDFMNQAPADVTATPGEPGVVTVRWTPGAASFVTVTWAVERRRGDGAWERVAEGLERAVTELTDAAAPPRARVSYRVLALAAADESEAVVQRARAAGTYTGLGPEEERAESQPSAEVEVATDLYLLPRSVNEGLAHGEVVRWDPAARGWKRARFGGKVGDEVAPGVVLEEVGEDRGKPWVRVRLPATGEVLTEDSRRERLPQVR